MSHIKGQSALGVCDLGASDCGLVAGGLQAALPFVSALKKIRHPKIELLGQIEIVGRKITGLKMGMNWESAPKLGLGRKFAVISCAWFCRIKVRVALME